MKTTWRVTKITETEGQKVAELRQVEWFKKNPAYTEMMDAYSDLVEEIGQEAADAQTAAEPSDAWIEEYLDADPGDPDAQFIDAFGTLTVDITDGLDLHAGDDVELTLDALERVSS